MALNDTYLHLVFSLYVVHQMLMLSDLYTDQLTLLQGCLIANCFVFAGAQREAEGVGEQGHAVQSGA